MFVVATPSATLRHLDMTFKMPLVAFKLLNTYHLLSLEHLCTCLSTGHTVDIFAHKLTVLYGYHYTARISNQWLFAAEDDKRGTFPSVL